MATKTASTNAAQEQDGDTTLLDTRSSAVKKLSAKGRERGCITFDELNAVLPQDKMSSEQIEDIMAVLSEMGIQVVEIEDNDNEEAEPKKAAAESEDAEEEAETEAEAESESHHIQSDKPSTHQEETIPREF